MKRKTTELRNATLKEERKSTTYGNDLIGAIRSGGNGYLSPYDPERIQDCRGQTC